MLENNRKRARKCKLEVREGAELEEASFSFMEFPKEEKIEEKVLPVPPEIEKKYQPTSELGDPFKNVEISVPPSKMEFSVKIEVEECNEEEPESLKDSSPSKHKRRIIISAVKADPATSNVFHATKSSAIQPSSSVNRSPLNAQDEFKEYVTNRPMLLRIVTCLLKSDNVADNFLATMVRNYAGRVPDVRQVDLKQRLLQLVLEDWMVWYKSHSAVRDSPLLYKCYICGKSWWFLSELNDHIPEHLNPILKFQLSIEFDNDECNLVCFQHDVEQIKVEYPDTNCYRCGKRADSHCFATKKPYKCTGCETTFSTCSQLTMHEGVCLAYKNENFKDLASTTGQTNCNICLLECYTETRLNKHSETRHTVRSDIVTVWELTQCALCMDYYVHPVFHTCVQRTNNYGCNFCGRSFQKKIYKEIHMENYNKPVECRICDRPLSAKCMEPSHMLLHTDKFALMYKCIECAAGRYYQDEFSIAHHTKIIHKRAFVKKFKYLEMVILPKQSLEMVKKYKVYKIEKQDDGTQNPPPINPPNDLPEETENMSSDLPMGVTIKEEPIDIYMDTSTSLTMADICVKTEKLDEESTIQISDITSLHVKQETVDEDVMLVEREADVVSVCSSEDGGGRQDDGRVTKSGRPKKKKPAKYICMCGFTSVHREMKLHKQVCSKIRRRKKRSARHSFINEDKVHSSASDHDSDGVDQSSNEEDNEEWDPNIVGMGYKRKRRYVCKCNSFVGNMAEYQVHRETCAVSKIFKCTKCENAYQNFSKYVRHFNTRHGHRRHTCPHCLCVLDSFPKLVSHVSSHVTKQFVKLRLIEDNLKRVKGNTCRDCQVMVDKKDFFSHWESHLMLKTKEERIEALQERKASATSASLFSPEVMKKGLDRLQSGEANGRPVRECPFCARTFGRQNDCKRHMVEHLLSDAYSHKPALGKLRCQICHRDHDKPDRYKHHMREHASLPIYQCNLCSKSFSDSSNFCKHKKVHDLALLCCDICQKKFHHQVTYDKHMEMHETTKPIVCTVCSRVSYTQSAHRKHVRVSHEKHRTQFSCPVCRQRFRRLRDKWDHLWLVHKERKAAADCPMCGQAFRRLVDVRAHARRLHAADVRFDSEGMPYVLQD